MKLDQLVWICVSFIGHKTCWFICYWMKKHRNVITNSKTKAYWKRKLRKLTVDQISDRAAGIRACSNVQISVRLVWYTCSLHMQPSMHFVPEFMWVLCYGVHIQYEWVCVCAWLKMNYIPKKVERERQRERGPRLLPNTGQRWWSDALWATKTIWREKHHQWMEKTRTGRQIQTRKQEDESKSNEY